ncbi:MAG: triphosphoribosyl-dephospho-CoA synthase [Desulfurococcus sp.]|uniref:triphosphoribosyl-dephospho-CoA synthase n=3 Tax=Desulfurococcus sp. TaxID=51678 RepID=UPI00316381EB
MQASILEDFSRALSLALILEASAWPKPGNVHRLRDRPDLRYEAFLATGVMAYSYFRKGIKRGLKGWRSIVLGDLIYGLVSDSMRKTPSSNTCLGSSTLLIPLSLGLGRCIAKGIPGLECVIGEAMEALNGAGVWDTIYYYRAVRTASPSYLKPSDDTGEYVNIWDPHYARKLAEKNTRLIDVLKYSSRIDVVADELVNGYKRSIASERFLRERFNLHGDWNRSVVETYLYILTENNDTIVLLKHGAGMVEYVKKRAGEVLSMVLKDNSSEWMKPVTLLDEELYRLKVNPGAVADLTVSSIALFLLKNIIQGDAFLKPSIV